MQRRRGILDKIKVARSSKEYNFQTSRVKHNKTILIHSYSPLIKKQNKQNKKGLEKCLCD